MRCNIRAGNPQFVALVGGRVFAWCDVTPEKRETMMHGGVFGIGVIESHRGFGIGPAVLRATLDQAKKAGFKRVELTVREDNLRAKSLYELAGFVTEGVKRKAALFDGNYYDLILMSLLFLNASAGCCRRRWRFRTGGTRARRCRAAPGARAAGA